MGENVQILVDVLQIAYFHQSYFKAQLFATPAILVSACVCVCVRACLYAYYEITSALFVLSASSGLPQK